MIVPANQRRHVRMLVSTATCLLVSLMAPGVRADEVQSGAVNGAHLRAMIDCGLWLSTLDDCPGTPGSAAAGVGAAGVGAAGVGAAGAASTPGPFQRPDFDGIKRDTYYFLGLQLSVIGALYFMPESVSGWSQEQKDQHRADKWWSNVTDPTWDEDDHYINYALHPYWGAAYYVRARERGYGGRQAFWYSFLLSTLYEGGVEAMFEPISIQDFFVTPIVGSWLGAYFMDWRDATEARIAETGRRRFRDSALLVATDPLGHAADFVDRRLGRDADFTATPFVTRGMLWRPSGSLPRPERDLDETYGVTLTLRW